MEQAAERDDAHPGAGREGLRDVASLGELTPDVLRKTFPGWRVFADRGVWWATREGAQAWIGAKSLLARVITAPDLPALAQRLCLQEWLDGLEPDKLADVYRDTLQGSAR